MKLTMGLLVLMASATVALAQTQAPQPEPATNGTAQSTDSQAAENPRHHWPPPPEKPPAPARPVDNGAVSTGVEPEPPADPSLRQGHALDPKDVATLTGQDSTERPRVAPQVYVNGGVPIYGSQFGRHGYGQFGASQFVSRPPVSVFFGRGGRRNNFILLPNTGFGAPVFIPVFGGGGGQTVFFGFSHW